MANLGSLAALIADINAKVTTNAANENTGSRVNQCLQNIADTLNAICVTSVNGDTGPVVSLGSTSIPDQSTLGTANVTEALDTIVDFLNNLPAPPVNSVNGETGSVVLTAPDIDVTDTFVSVTLSSVFDNMIFKKVGGITYEGVIDPTYTLFPVGGYWRLQTPVSGILYSQTPDTDPATSIRGWTANIGTNNELPGGVSAEFGPTVEDALYASAIAPVSPIVRTTLGANGLSEIDFYGPTTILANTAGLPFNWIISTGLSVPIGSFVNIIQYSNDAITFSTDGLGATIDSLLNLVTSAGRYAVMTVTCIGADQYILSGDLV